MYKFRTKLFSSRSYGTFPRKIREYVKEKKWITMEQAIRAATSLPRRGSWLRPIGGA